MTWLVCSAGTVTACGRGEPVVRAVTPVAVVSLISVAGMPFIAIRTDSAAPHLWLLDGGFETSVINSRFADTLRLGTYTHEQAAVPGGHTDVGQVPGIPLHIGEVTFHPDSLAVVDLQNVEPLLGLPYSGILGHDFLMRYVVRIDYDRNEVQLFDPSTFAYTGPGKALPIWIEEGQSFALGFLYADGRATPAKLKFDTGSLDVLGLNGSFVQQTDLVGKDRPKVPAMGAALGGMTTAYVVRLDSMSLGDVVIPKPVAAYSTDLRRRRDAGTMGVGLLARFNLIFDYARHRVILEATERSHQPMRYDASGLLVTGAGAEYRAVVVLSVDQNSPASAAGVQPGDSIIMIDGTPASDLGLSAIRERFTQPGAVRLQLVHQGRPREVLLNLRERL